MITDRHRELADDIHNQLKSVTTLDKRKVESIGGEVYEVLDWLVNGEIINRQQYGYTKGQKFYTYSGLENLLNPPKEITTVNLVGPKKSTLETTYLYIMITTSIGMLFFAGLTLSRETKYNKAQQLYDTAQADKSKLIEQVRALEHSLKDKETDNSLLSQKIDSLTKELKVKK